MATYIEKKMKQRRLSYNFCGCYVFILTLLEVLGKTHMSVHDNNHAFIQSNSNDVNFMGVHEGLQVFMNKDVASSSMSISKVHEDVDSEDAFSTSTYLKFVPPKLDFKERHLGVPHLETVTLVNTDDNKTIHMSSVSGNTLHFHSSFFQDKTIPPKGNTTFAVVFLGRAEGQVSSSLFIHTSEGTFKYHVSGASVLSPYRLKPLGGVRLPLNAAFHPLIHLHNPHHYPIQVVEVYSSGSEFHLELPGGEMEGPKAIWEVPPYTTKPVIRAKFQAIAQSNYTAYIRLKLNNSEEVLVVPLEVEVMSQRGLYSHQHLIDFGIGGSQDEPKKLILYLCSSLKKALRIQSVTALPASSPLKIKFEGAKIPPGSTSVEVAELTFDWKVAYETKQTSGKILIKSKQNQYKLGIPFTATVLEGGLEVNETVTRFLTTDSKHGPRNFTVVNQFKIPIAINSVSLLEEASKYFQIKRFRPTVVSPGRSAVLFTVSPKESSLRDLKLESGLVLFTNVSDVKVSLLSYNGRLTKIFPRGFEDFELLDVGLVGSGSTKTIRFGLQNNNPVTIELGSLGSNSQYIVPEILGIFKGNATQFLSHYNSFANLTYSTKLKPDAIAVVELVIEASDNEETMSALITIKSQYEKLTIPVRVSVAHGALEMIPKQIVFDDCFPGRVCSQPLKIRSTFNRPMTATSIMSVPPDSRLSFKGAPGGSEILPNSNNYIGDLKWEPGKSCGSHCYLGISLNSSGGGLQWMQSELSSPYIGDMDATLLRDRYHRLLNLTNGFGSGHWQDVVLRLDTNEVREELFQAKVRLIWPKFSNVSKLTFPLTQVFNTTVQRLKLYNPASHMVVVQLVTEWAYPQAKRLLESFPPSFKTNLGGHCFNSSPKEFYMVQNDLPESNEPIGKLNTTLAPGENYEVAIGYTPRSPQKSCSLLIIRNNLTIIEVIELHGQAAHAQLKFGNRKPGSDNPLMFEISEKHLKDCHKEKNKKHSYPSLTVKRSFTLRNVGDLPIYIHNFYINGLECEGYGFSVLNCGSFRLATNATKKIDIAFTPDFTLTRVYRTLRVETSLGIEVNYTLITTVPQIFLSVCASALTRPSWEPLLYYSSVSFMIFLLFCIFAAAYFEADRILKCILVTMTRDKTTVPLDLKQVGTTVLKEFNQYKRVESEIGEKGKTKESGWMGSADERQFVTAHKDDKYETHTKSEECTECGHKGKDSNSSNSILSNGSGVVLNLTKNKKKLGKKNSNSSDAGGEQTHESYSNKKRDKNFSNSGGWCNVFSRGSGSSAEKMKMKIGNDGENVKHKEEEKRELNKKGGGKGRKMIQKEPSKEEEETSSTTTDSSNDAEKENSDSMTTRFKNEKFRKVTGKGERKSNVLECKENNYEGDFDDEEFEKEKKIVGAKNGWRVNTKGNKSVNIGEGNLNAWKQSPGENQKNSQKSQKNAREKKEKNVSKKRLTEKAGNQKAVETSSVHPNTICWEQRSFSEVVGKNDGPLLYSNIVSANSQHQKQQPTQSSPGYSESAKGSETSGCPLGPIGPKKPLSSWTSIPYGAGGSQSNLYSINYPESVPGIPIISPMYTSSVASDYLTEGMPESTSHDDSLQIDAENLWEDQHAAMQLMHQQDSNYQLSWKDNWLDYLWCTGRSGQHSTEHLQPQDSYADQSWSSLFNSSWPSSAFWNPAADPTQSSLMDENMNRFGSYLPMTETNSLMSHDMQSTPGVMEMDMGAVSQNGADILNPLLFSQNSMTTHLPRTQSRENLAGQLEQFDPFHSLSSIWSPKSQNSWDSP